MIISMNIYKEISVVGCQGPVVGPSSSPGERLDEATDDWLLAPNHGMIFVESPSSLAVSESRMKEPARAVDAGAGSIERRRGAVPGTEARRFESELGLFGLLL